MRFQPSSLAGCLAACCAFATTLAAQANASDAALALETETRLVAQALQAAKRDAHDEADVHLAARGVGSVGSVSPSVLLARRTAEVCATLRNENDYGRAIRVAERAIALLAKLKEDNNEDRVERLYWEAALEADILDQKKRAIELLKEAEAISPKDERVILLQLRLVAAVAEFGR